MAVQVVLVAHVQQEAATVVSAEVPAVNGARQVLQVLAEATQVEQA